MGNTLKHTLWLAMVVVLSSTTVSGDFPKQHLFRIRQQLDLVANESVSKVLKRELAKSLVIHGEIDEALAILSEAQLADTDTSLEKAIVKIAKSSAEAGYEKQATLWIERSVRLLPSDRTESSMAGLMLRSGLYEQAAERRAAESQTIPWQCRAVQGTVAAAVQQLRAEGVDVLDESDELLRVAEFLAYKGKMEDAWELCKEAFPTELHEKTVAKLFARVICRHGVGPAKRLIAVLPDGPFRLSLDAVSKQIAKIPETTTLVEHDERFVAGLISSPPENQIWDILESAEIARRQGLSRTANQQCTWAARLIGRSALHGHRFEVGSSNGQILLQSKAAGACFARQGNLRAALEAISAIKKWRELFWQESLGLIGRCLPQEERNRIELHPVYLECDAETQIRLLLSVLDAPCTTAYTYWQEESYVEHVCIVSHIARDVWDAHSRPPRVTPAMARMILETQSQEFIAKWFRLTGLENYQPAALTYSLLRASPKSLDADLFLLCLQHSDPLVRVCAIHRGINIDMLDQHQFREPLLSLSCSLDSSIRYRALRLLFDCRWNGSEDLSLLLVHRNDPDPSIRYLALRLTGASDAELSAASSQVLFADDHSWLRSVAATHVANAAGHDPAMGSLLSQVLRSDDQFAILKAAGSKLPPQFAALAKTALERISQAPHSEALGRRTQEILTQDGMVR